MHKGSSDFLAGLLSGAIGALLGALIGAYSTFRVTRIDRQKKSQIDEIQYLRIRIRNDAVTVGEIDSILHITLTRARANEDMYEQLSKGIVDKDRKFIININSALPYEEASIDRSTLFNNEIEAQWSSLFIEFGFQNSNIISFNNYYQSLFNSIHKAMLNGVQLDPTTIFSDNESVKSHIKGLKLANNSLIDRCIRFKAMAIAYIEEFEAIDYDTATVERLRKYRLRLIEKGFTNNDLKKYIRDLNKTYSGKIFKAHNS